MRAFCLFLVRLHLVFIQLQDIFRPQRDLLKTILDYFYFCVCLQGGTVSGVAVSTVASQPSAHLNALLCVLLSSCVLLRPLGFLLQSGDAAEVADDSQSSTGTSAL